jgi:mannose-1-phosphate guanylyltransferase
MKSTTELVGIALAGVLAWRPNSLDAVVQRPLLPLANRPWIEHFIGHLRVGNITRVAICVNRLSEPLLALIRRVSRDLADIQVFVDGPPRGSAGCCRDVAEIMPAPRYMIVESLVVPRLDVSQLLDFHAGSGNAATVVVDGNDSGSEVNGAIAHPVGIHVADRDFLLTTAATGYQDLKEVLINRAVRGGAAIGVFPSPVPNPRITDLPSYLDAQELLMEGDLAGQESRAWNGAQAYPVRVHPSAEIGVGARITGPAIIGAGTVVHERAAIIGACTIGSGCVIGENAIVADSTLWDNCTVSDDAVLSECVLSSGTHVAAGTRKERELLLGSVTS